MTDEERRQEGAEEEIEDLEAPAAAQSEVAGGIGIGPCAPTNRCAPVNTVVNCRAPTQVCGIPTCAKTEVYEA